MQTNARPPWDLESAQGRGAISNRKAVIQKRGADERGLHGLLEYCTPWSLSGGIEL